MSSIRLFVFALCLVLASCNRDEVYYEPGVSLELAAHRSNTINNVIYHLTIAIPEDSNSPINGKEIIEFEISDLSKDLLLDFKEDATFLKVVTVNGASVKTDFENEHLIIDSDDLVLGKNEVSIDLRIGETSLNRNKDYLYTLFVPERARTAFPCFDQPNIKTNYNLTLEIPEAWRAIANAPVLSEEIEAGKKTIVYSPTKPISTYLFDFVVGKFEAITREVDGRTITMLHRESDKEKVERNLDKIFELHQVGLNWLEDYTGINYPFQKFDFALIPSFQYGGMEHPGAITYKAESLFLNENPTQNQLLGRASLIAHETAHMWFGDLVTMDWFSDVWMKEVFANFMAAKIVNPSFPEVNHELRFLLAHYPSAYAVDRSKGTHPIQQELLNLQDAGSLYGSIIYQKAPIAMRMLERIIGPETFQSGIQQYLNDYSFSNATWDDLIGILDSLTDEDLTEWSEMWIKTAGMPRVVPMIREENDSTIRKFSYFQFDNEGEVYRPQDLAVLLEASDSIYQYDVKLRGQRVDIDEAKGLWHATFILSNSEGYGYGYFPMGPLTRARWLENIEDFRNPVHRGVGWVSLYESMLRRAVSTEDYLKAVIRNLPLEEDPLIQQYMLSSMRTIFWSLITPEDRLRNAEGLEEVLWSQISKLKDNRLKRSYFNTYRSIALSELGVRRLYDIWSNELTIQGLVISENDDTQLACELAIRNWPDADEVLEAQIEKISNPDRQERLKFIKPSLSPQKEIRDAFFESLKEVENRHHESWVQTAVGYLHHPLRAKEAVEYITPTLEMLEEIQQTGDIFFPKRVLDNTFFGHSSYESMDAVRQFLYRNNHYPKNLKNKILQATDMTFRAEERLRDRPDSVKVVVFD